MFLIERLPLISVKIGSDVKSPQTEIKLLVNQGRVGTSAKVVFMKLYFLSRKQMHIPISFMGIRGTGSEGSILPMVSQIEFKT